MSRDPEATYYDAGGIETIDIIRAKLSPEEYRGYLKGNVLKYACRLDLKDPPRRDVQKLFNYTTWLKELE